MAGLLPADLIPRASFLLTVKDFYAKYFSSLCLYICFTSSFLDFCILGKWSPSSVFLRIGLGGS